MPRYTIQAPDGRKVTLEGDSPPTEKELEEVFSSLPESGKRNISELTPEEVTATLGRAPDREEARRLAAVRLIDKERRAGMPRELVLTPEGGVGVVGGGAGGQAFSATRGAARTSTFGLSEPLLAAALRIGQAIRGAKPQDERDTNILDATERQNPLSEEVGGDAAILMPGAPGRAAKAALPVRGAGVLSSLGRILKGAGIGAAGAGTAIASDEAAREIRSGEGVSPGQIAEAPLENPRALLIGAALGSAPQAIQSTASAVSKMKTRGWKTPTIEKAQGVLGMTHEEGLGDVLAVAPREILQDNGGKAPATGAEAVAAAERTKKRLLQTTRKYLNEAGNAGYTMDGDKILDDVRSQVISTHPSLENSPVGVEKAMNKLNHLEGEINPVKGQQYLVELNRDYEAMIEKAGQRNSPEATAFLAARKALSDQVDSMVKAVSGEDISPYRDWGQVERFQKGIQNSINATERAAGSEAVPKGTEGLGMGATPKYLVERSIVHKLARPFRMRGVERVDDAVQSIFKDAQSQPTKPLAAPAADSAREQLMRDRLLRESAEGVGENLGNVIASELEKKQAAQEVQASRTASALSAAEREAAKSEAVREADRIARELLLRRVAKQPFREQYY